MERKRDRTLRLLQQNDSMITCPVCSEILKPGDNHTLICAHGHSFDISKKGTINLVGKGNDSLYNSSLFHSRRFVIEKGYYAPLTDMIISEIEKGFGKDKNSIDVLDAGCGEGSFLSKISKGIQGSFWGVDLSKEGINIATMNDADIVWIIDDLADMHLEDSSFDLILNILSPANYNEFHRVLKKDGLIIKVLPGSDYLKEIRAIISDDTNKRYDNTETVKHTVAEIDVIQQQKIKYHIDIPSEDFQQFLNMTPMTSGKNIETIPLQNKKIYGLTIDLEIFVGRII